MTIRRLSHFRDQPFVDVDISCLIEFEFEFFENYHFQVTSVVVTVFFSSFTTN